MYTTTTTLSKRHDVPIRIEIDRLKLDKKEITV
jgi:hypothetical protein